MRALVPLLIAWSLIGGFAATATADQNVSGPISVPTTWNAIDSPYIVDGDVTVDAGATLTIEEGVVVKFDPGHRLTVNGNLQAIGTTQRIVFTSIRDDNVAGDTNGDGNASVPARRDWRGIVFASGSDPSSTLDGVDVRFAGNGNIGSVRCEGDASPEIANCDLSFGFIGVESLGTSGPQLRSTEINAMIDVPVQISISADPVFDSVSFGSTENNGFDAIGMLGGTLTGSSTWRVREAAIGVGGSAIPNLTYILQSDITVAAGATLSFEPGVVVKPRAGVDIFVDGTLTMDGDSGPGETVVFTSFKDDTVGDPLDTNGDGSTTSPVKNDWGQIEFRAGASGSIRFADLRYGKNGQGVVRMTDLGTGSPTIADVSFSNTDYGIELVGLNDAAIIDCSFSNTTFTPVLMSLVASPTFSGNSISNAGIAAIGLRGETVGVDTTLDPRDFGGFTNITYWLADDLTIPAGVKLTVSAGVVTKVGVRTGPNQATGIVVFGALTAVGTASEPVVFTALYDDSYGSPADTQGDGGVIVPQTGDWAQIRIADSSVDAETIFENCVLRYGGAGVWMTSASPTISDCDIVAMFDGIRIDGNSSPSISNTAISLCTRVPVAVSAVSSPTFSGNAISQNAADAIGLLPESLAADATIEEIPATAFSAYPSGIPYLPIDGLTVGAGVTLTIEPGVIVKADRGADRIVVEGDLVVGSTSGPRVIFTSLEDDSVVGDTNNDGTQTVPAAGDWSGIEFQPGSGATSVIENALFRFGGRRSANTRATVTTLSASPTIRECEFEFVERGLWLQGTSDVVVENNAFLGCTDVPISKSVVAEPTFTGNSFANNALDLLGLIGETLGVDATLRKWDVAGFTNITRGLVKDNFTVALGSTLTIEPGVVLKLGRTESLTVPRDPLWGRIFVNGGIVAVGTLAEPIVFTTIRDDRYGNPADSNRDGSLSTPFAPGWGFISLADTSDDAVTIFESCVFAYAGSDGNNFGAPLILTTASPTIRSCEFDRNQEYGIELLGDSQPVLEDNTFGGQGIAPIRVSAVAAQFLGANSTGNVFLENNANNVLSLVDETLAADVTLPRIAMGQIENVPYFLEPSSTLTVGLSSSLTIDPGVIVKMDTFARIVVKRSLIALGDSTAEGLIVFTSIDDDFYGGDSNLDGDATVPTANRRWAAIQIENTAIDTELQFQNVMFRYGGRASVDGALDLNSANPVLLDRCVFERNRVGIRFEGVSGDPATMQITNSDFQDNEVYAVENVSGSFVVSAAGNWWGDPTGPLDNSNDVASGGDYNPDGLGDRVTDEVDYSSYAVSGVQNLTLGDVSRNGEIRAFDASLVLQDVVGLITLDAGQRALGDVRCSGSLTAFDAGLILEYVAGLSEFFPCQFENVPTRMIPDWTGYEEGEFQVSMPDVAVGAGESVEFTIGLTGQGELLAHTYRLRFDPDRVVVEDVMTTSATSAAALHWNESSAGVLDIALATGEVLDVTDGVRIRIRGRAEVAPGEFGTVTLERAMLNEQVVVSEVTDATVPSRHDFGLDPNRPNPFNPSTTIQFSVPGMASDEALVELVVFDVQGRLVRSLLAERLSAGDHSIVWDGRDDAGRMVSSGLYLYRLNAGDQSDVRKMMLLK